MFRSSPAPAEDVRGESTRSEPDHEPKKELPEKKLHLFRHLANENRFDPGTTTVPSFQSMGSSCREIRFPTVPWYLQCRLETPIGQGDPTRRRRL